MDQPTNQTVQTAKREWSWGAFMFDPMVLLASRRYYMLLWYLLAFIPVINVLFMIAFKIYMGLKGRGIVAASPSFASEEERRGFMKGIDHAGFIMFFIALAGLAVGLIASLSGLIGFAKGGWMMQNGQFPVELEYDFKDGAY